MSVVSYAVPDPLRYLCHYTRTESAALILYSGRLRLGRFQHVDDPRENKPWLFGVRDSPGSPIPPLPYQQNADAYFKQAQVLCFTLDHRPSRPAPGYLYHRGHARPRMWSQYADRHRGACLIFDRERLAARVKEATLDSEIAEGRVEYLDEGDVLGDPFTLDAYDPARPPEEVYESHLVAHLEAMFLRKLEDWRDEREYRFIVTPAHQRSEFVEYDDSLIAVIAGSAFDDMSTAGRELMNVVLKTDCPSFAMHWRNGAPDLSMFILDHSREMMERSLGKGEDYFASDDPR